MKRQRENSVENILRSISGDLIGQEVYSEEKKICFRCKAALDCEHSQISGDAKERENHTRKSENPRTHSTRGVLPIVPLTVPNRMQP